MAAQSWRREHTDGDVKVRAALHAREALRDMISPPNQRGENLHRDSCVVSPGRAMHEQL